MPAAPKHQAGYHSLQQGAIWWSKGWGFASERQPIRLAEEQSGEVSIKPNIREALLRFAPPFRLAEEQEIKDTVTFHTVYCEDTQETINSYAEYLRSKHWKMVKEWFWKTKAK